MIDTASRLHLAGDEDGSWGVSVEDERADNTRIIAPPRPTINTSTTNSADVNTCLRGAICPLCGHGSHCVRGGTRSQIWRCDNEDCQVEFRASLPGRPKRLEVAG